MKLSWTEPWSREMIRQRIREANLAMPSVWKISLWSGILSLGVMIGVRLLLQESGEMLTWERMIGMALACASYPRIAYLPVIVPMGVRLVCAGMDADADAAGRRDARDVECVPEGGWSFTIF